MVGTYILLILAALFVAGGFIAKRFKKTYKILSITEDKTIYEIKVPRLTEEEDTFKTSSMAMESFFASLHGLLKSKGEEDEFFSFEIISRPGSGIRFYVTCSKKSAPYLEGQIYANYPYAQLIAMDNNFDPHTESYWEMAQLSEIKNQIFPLKTYNDLEIDTMSSITSAMSQLQEGDITAFQLLTKPIGDVWQKEGNDYVSTMKTGKAPKQGTPGQNLLFMVLSEFFSIVFRIFSEAASIFGGSTTSDTVKDTRGTVAPPPKLTIVQEMEVNSIENKMAKMGFSSQIRFLVCANSEARAKQNIRSVVASMNQFSTTNLNSLIVGHSLTGREAYDTFVNRVFDESQSYVLNVEELGSLYHMPSQKVETPNINWSYSRKSEPPAGLPVENCTYIGETVYRDKKVRFGLAHGDDRLRHMYVIGKSGTGKSTLFETMIAQDMANGFGVGVLDPHGETIEHILDRIPSNRVDDVIYFDPSDSEMPVGLNLLEMDDPSEKNLMASALVSAIKHHFDYSWGPRLEYLLNYAILTLLEVQGTTMLGITRLLEDDNYRKFILHHVKDPVVLKFWDTEFKNMKNNPKLISEAVAPIQNKVNRFLASSTIRNILGQRKSTIDIDDAMNNGKILLMNLSKGKIGEDNANLLGALLVSRIQFFALQRAKIPAQKRRPFYLYVDEFQNFATGSFESILSESRKYGLGLYLTHQYTAQLSEELLSAVLGNVGTIAAFALGTPDAKALAGEFAPYFTDTDIISLERFHVYMKLMMNGMTSLPFSAKILRPWIDEETMVPKNNNRQWVVELSRQKYGVDRVAVEDKVRVWVDTPFDKGMALAFENKGANISTQPAPIVAQAVPLPPTQPVVAPRPVAKVPAPERRLAEKPQKTMQPPLKPAPKPIPQTAVQPAVAQVEILARGMFDGTDMVTKEGKRYPVHSNYAAKSELVYGDQLEMYKEDGKDRFRQSVKIERQDIEGTIEKDNANLWVLKTLDGKMYPVSQSAVDFNEFKAGQRMYGTIPAGENGIVFCTLALKKFRKDSQKKDEAEKIRTDQNLR